MNQATFSRFACTLVLAVAPLAAYDLPDLSDGFTLPEVEQGPLEGGYPTFDVGTVSLFSGKLSVSIAVRTVGGRGGAGYTISVPINQSWTVDKEWDSHLVETPVPSVWSTTQSGLTPGVIEGRNAIKRIGTSCSSLGYYDYSLARITFIGPGGGEIELRDKLTNGEPYDQGGTSCTFNTSNNRGKVFISGDGSGATFVSTVDIYDGTASIFYPDGTLYLPNGNAYTVVDGLITQIRDPNGNFLTLAYDTSNRPTEVVDSTGRATDLLYGGADYVFWEGYEGSVRTAAIGYKDQSDLMEGDTVQYTDVLFPELHIHDEVLFDPQKVSHVALPSGQYHFTYNRYGDVVKILLPGGAQRARVEYEWESGIAYPGGGGFSTDRSALLRRVKRSDVTPPRRRRQFPRRRLTPGKRQAIANPWIQWREPWLR